MSEPTEEDLAALRFALQPFAGLTTEQLRTLFVYHLGLETTVRDVIAVIVAARLVAAREAVG